MKINFDFDCDIVHEDGSLDDNIRQGVVLRILDEMKKEISDLIRKEAQIVIHQQLESIVSEQLLLPFQPHDKWGDAKGEVTTLRDLIKKQYSEFMVEKVDSSGRAGCYDAKTPRIEYYVEKQVEEQFDYQFKQMLAKEAEKAKETMSVKIAEVLSSALVQK
jgi:hypothetical protein